MNTREHVLIVDDDEVARTRLGVGLEEQGFTVSLSSCIHNGWEKLNSEEIDLILLDIFLGKEDGMEMLRELNRQYPQLPVIMMTGHGSIVTVMEALHLGASDYILKPSEPSSVAHRIQHIMENIRVRQMADRSRTWRERLKGLQVLAAGVSNDLNNQLTVLLDSTHEAIKQAGDNPHLLEEINWIYYSAGNIRRLAEKLMNFSGKNQLNFSRVDLVTFIPEVLDEVKAKVPGHIEAHFEVNLQEVMQAEIMADRKALQKALQQAVVNASEAASVDRVRVDLRLRKKIIRDPLFPPNAHAPMIEPGAYYAIELEDRAGGMDSVTLNNVFDPFFSTKFPGRGLGLPSAQGVLISHGGGIHITSEEGKGSKVCFFLPIEVPEIMQEAEPSAPKEKDTVMQIKQSVSKQLISGGDTQPIPTAPNKCVLMIEDEEIVRRSSERMLSKMKLDILSARNASEALDIVHRDLEKIDLILLDWSLPDMRGDEVFREIRACGCKAPVILTSGYSATEVMNEFVTEKPEAFMHKPYDSKTLLKAARKQLDL